MTRVLVTCPQMQASFKAFEPTFASLGIDPYLPPVTQAMSEADLLEIIDGYDGVIAGDDSFTAAVLARGSRLRIISKGGVGVDGIDLEEARRRGVAVTNTPGVFDSEVADVCIGYLILLARQLHLIDAAVRAGEWWKPAGVTLAGRVLGVVGLGSIGMAVARRAQAMDMVVTGCDVDGAACRRAAEEGLKVVAFDDLLGRAQALSLNCPLTSKSHHLLDRRAFGLMRDGVLVVNTARGGLIDEAALVDALEAGKVGGAALDVFEEEPIGPTSALLEFEQVVLGSHNSSNTVDAVERVSAMAVGNLLAGLRPA
jgi:D-3-phosphoglycerate dehydrogenase